MTKLSKKQVLERVITLNGNCFSNILGDNIKNHCGNTCGICPINLECTSLYLNLTFSYDARVELAKNTLAKIYVEEILLGDKSEEE